MRISIINTNAYVSKEELFLGLDFIKESLPEINGINILDGSSTPELELIIEWAEKNKMFIETFKSYAGHFSNESKEIIMFLHDGVFIRNVSMDSTDFKTYSEIRNFR